MAINNIVPSRKRSLDKNGGIVFSEEYEVDGEAIPELVARGVLDFQYLQMRSDFGVRFGDCECAQDVIAVLSAEGYWDVRKSVSDADVIADIAPSDADKSANDCGQEIDADWQKITDPVERRRAYDRVKKRERRAAKKAT